MNIKKNIIKNNDPESLRDLGGKISSDGKFPSRVANIFNITGPPFIQIKIIINNK